MIIIVSPCLLYNDSISFIMLQDQTQYLTEKDELIKVTVLMGKKTYRKLGVVIII